MIDGELKAESAILNRNPTSKYHYICVNNLYLNGASVRHITREFSQQ